ncbi:hypothetical protein DER45DRAFT_537336 [Fusarium avenaceum]|nr:hypothetical protein DER45DRAFT_537336 [Fusarium avenaceum]
MICRITEDKAREGLIGRRSRPSKTTGTTNWLSWEPIINARFACSDRRAGELFDVVGCTWTMRQGDWLMGSLHFRSGNKKKGGQTREQVAIAALKARQGACPFLLVTLLVGYGYSLEVSNKLNASPQTVEATGTVTSHNSRPCSTGHTHTQQWITITITRLKAHTINQSAPSFFNSCTPSQSSLENPVPPRDREVKSFPISTFEPVTFAGRRRQVVHAHQTSTTRYKLIGLQGQAASQKRGWMMHHA